MLETRGGGTLCTKQQEEANQISVYLCIIYGIVTIETNSYNKCLYTY